MMSELSQYHPEKIAVVGAGPVGCIVAAFLAKGGCDVTLCDVAPHLLAPAMDPGIVISGAENLTQKVARTCRNVDELADQNIDLIIITVKASALPLLASAIESFHRPGMFVVSWQNGIDTELVLANTLGREHVMRAVVNYGCSLVEPGHVDMPFHHPPHYIQELDTSAKDAAQTIADLFTRCGLPTEHTDRLISMVWRKSIMNACMNPVCAVTGQTMSQAMNDPIILQIIDLLVKESIMVARANEISLGWDFYTYCMGYMRNAGDHKPSMLVDIENHRRTEIDFINGKIVEYGRQAGVETPYNLMIRALVKALEGKKSPDTTS
jgi:2-dehydropantoate 2-reductase